MPAPVNRISVTTASLRQQKLLEYQAGLTGRSISSLASSLLEEIVDQKVREGRWEPIAVQMVNELITAKTWVEGPGHDELMAKLAQESIDVQGDIHMSKAEFVAQNHPDAEGMIEEHNSFLPRKDQPQESYFAARFAESVKQATESAEERKAKEREEELVAYGMRYGLVREHAEDIYEWYSGGGRARVRAEMREAAGVSERLAEGDEVIGSATDTNTKPAKVDPNAWNTSTADPDDGPF